MLTFSELLNQIRLESEPNRVNEKYKSDDRMDDVYDGRIDEHDICDVRIDEHDICDVRINENDICDARIDENDERAKRTTFHIGGRKLYGADFAANIVYEITNLYDSNAAERFDTAGVFKYFYAYRVYDTVESEAYIPLMKRFITAGGEDTLSAEFYNNLGDPKFKEWTGILCDALINALKLCAKLVGSPDYEEYDVCMDCIKAVKRFKNSGKLRKTLANYPKFGGREWDYNNDDHEMFM